MIMGYTKVIISGKIIETYQYENEPRGFTRKSRDAQIASRNQSLALRREDENVKRQSEWRKRQDNIRRAKLAFRRIVLSNLDKHENPILVSLTYAENITDIRKGHKDFNSFAKLVRDRFGKNVSYLAVPEFQERGAIHFHALFWGLPNGLAQRERSTRVVASLWKQGYVDLVETDGSVKLAGYLVKYMAKAFSEPKLMMMKSYFASRNIKRPVVDKRAIMFSYQSTELSTAETLQERTFWTQWLGECHYKQFVIN